MMVTISDLAQEAAEIDYIRFLKLIKEVRDLLSIEPVVSRRLKIIGRLVHLPTSGKAIIIGDLHGDLDSLVQILTESRFMEDSLNGKEIYTVFLGDYGDRGSRSPEVFHVILKLKTLFPERIILLQGNHEGPENLLAYPHDLPYHLQTKFSLNWRQVYLELSTLFRRFYTATLVKNKYIMIHGGVPSRANTIEDLAFAYEKHPSESHLEEILWSDPSEVISGTHASPRGAGKLFGEDVTKSFLKLLHVNLIIRSHESSVKGYKISHNNKVLTLFSRKGRPYLNKYGSYLILDLKKPVKSKNQIKPLIHRF